MVPTTLLPFRRKSYSGFLRSEKIHRPLPGSNPRTSDPEANVYVNIQEQQQKCINELVLENSDSLFNKKLSYIRGTHRPLEYNKWCQLLVHGKGVILFQQYQPANSCMESRMELASTEWRDAIKLQGNLVPVKALHGRSQYNSRYKHLTSVNTPSCSWLLSLWRTSSK